MVVGGLVAAGAALAVARPAFADEEHVHASGPGGMAFTSAPVLWGVASLIGVLLFLVLFRVVLARVRVTPGGEHESGVGYLTAIRQFSRNARLFLGYSILAELGTGVWAVMFNLYLLRVGFPITFVATFWLVNMTCHGVAALPAGLIADRYGRRRSFFIATFISVTAQGSVLFTHTPAAILVLAGLAGFGEAFHGVTGAPFMMENSERHERVHLFSLNAAFLQISRFAGSLSGGLLPLAWAALLGVPAVDPQAARWALAGALPLTLAALLPLVFMREKPVELVESLRDLVNIRRLVSLGIILRLTLLGLMTGTAFGLTIRFFNVFFQESQGASDSQIGAILALGAIAGAGAILVSPVIAQRWGKVKGILYTQALSVPFLLLMALVPSLSVVTVFFLVRGTFYSMAQPLRNQLGMEMVTGKERGTTAGFTHAAFDLGGGAGAGMAGVLLAGGGFTTAFTAAAALILVPAILYYVFFAGIEARVSRRVPVAVPAGAGD
ncbi:MAG: MFS transporter [Chloroflexi bacterium]|nr:MFS transporter [Chloroflexota bacterium]